VENLKLGIPKRRWEDNVKGDREVVRARGLDSRGSGMDRVATVLETVMEIRIPQNVVNFLSNWATISLS
jgi:hypothetical protein